MQPPADTPGLCTPGHSVLSAARGMLTPFAPFLESFFSMLGFMNFAGARPLAPATPAVAITNAHASVSTTPGLMRIGFLPQDEMRARSRSAPGCSWWFPDAQAVKRERSDGRVPALDVRLGPVLAV